MCLLPIIGEYFEKATAGGEFFTQTVFMVMASVMFSSRICDFLIIYNNTELRDLQKKLDTALSNIALLESQNYSYKKLKEEVELDDKSLKKWVKWTFSLSRAWATVAALYCFHLIANGLGHDCGWEPLLLLVPVFVARMALWVKWQFVKVKCENKDSHFEDLERTYQQIVSKKERGMDDQLSEYNKDLESTCDIKQKEAEAPTAAEP